MSKIIISKWLSSFWLALVVLLLDVISKEWIMTHFLLGESIPVIPFINFTYIYNAGAAFSFLADMGEWPRWIFSLIAIVITIVLCILMFRSDKHVKWSNTAYAMMIGGTIGNLFDRIVHGVVIDFIDFYIQNWHWPTFNIADAGICIGSLLIIIKKFLFR